MDTYCEEGRPSSFFTRIFYCIRMQIAILFCAFLAAQPQSLSKNPVFHWCGSTQGFPRGEGI